ncbi:MAG TPA: ThuA domain-containing protein [Tepidisphaeraceae bacterium]|nr:ThuA domain-containing protein [Tepidisphaeraceae bacterium]
MSAAKRFFAALLATVVALGAHAQPAPPAKEKPKRPTAEDVAKIEAAIPDKAPAAPKKARKVLVFTKATGFVHSSIPVAARTIELMGKKTGAFEVTVTDDPKAFAADNLQQYDAVVMASTTGPLFVEKGVKEDLLYDPKATSLPADVKQAKDLRDSLIGFVKGGKGIMGIHAATDSSYKWKDYGVMMGGYFNGHPWGKITLHLDDPTNPVNAAFASEGKPFTISDEIYTFKETYDRSRLHILASIDIEASGINGGFNRPQDHDYGVSWLHRYGDGRVFYTLLGHREETYFNPAAVRHMLAGLQYALGDLEADDKPSGPLPADRLAKNMALAAKAFVKVSADEKWYKESKEKEQTFVGTLEAVPNAGGIGIVMRASHYKLGDRTVFTGGKKVKALDDLVGKKVEIKGKAVEMELEGQNLKEIWPGQVRAALEK